MTAYNLLMQTTGLQKQAAATQFPNLYTYLEKKAAEKEEEEKEKEEKKTDWGRIAALTLGALGTGAGGYALYQSLKNKGGISDLNTGLGNVDNKTKLNTAMLMADPNAHLLMGSTLQDLGKNPNHRQLMYDMGGTAQEALMNPAYATAVVNNDKEAFENLIKQSPLGQNPNLLELVGK